MDPRIPSFTISAYLFCDPNNPATSIPFFYDQPAHTIYDQNRPDRLRNTDLRLDDQSQPCTVRN